MFFQSCKALKILDAYKVTRDSKKGTAEARSWAAIALRLSGHSRFESNGKSYIADEGSVLYIPSGVSFSRKGSAESLIILHITCYEEEKEIEVIKPKNSALTQQAFLSIYNEWNAKAPGFEYRCTAMLYTALSQLKTQKRQTLPPYQSAIISPGIDMINSEFDKPSLTVARIASVCNVSEEYFRALYKAEYGISPHKAIVEKRIEKAKRLLEAGYFSISRVAEECGFQNTKYFSALFREKTNMTPNEYKNAHS